MTYRFGRTSRGRYAATLAGVPAYDPVSLKATSHLTAPAPTPTGNRAPLQGVRPVQTTVPGIDWEGHPTDPQFGCGEEEDGERRYGRTPKRRKKRRRRRKRFTKARATVSKARPGATRGSCDHLYDDSKPLGGTAYTDCILDLLR